MDCFGSPTRNSLPGRGIAFRSCRNDFVQRRVETADASYPAGLGSERQNCACARQHGKKLPLLQAKTESVDVQRSIGGEFRYSRKVERLGAVCPRSNQEPL